MLTTVFLCAFIEMSNGGALPCIPYTNMTQCLAAEKSIDIRFVVMSTCEEMEIFVVNKNEDSTAPELAPMPVPKPLYGQAI